MHGNSDIGPIVCCAASLQMVKFGSLVSLCSPTHLLTIMITPASVSPQVTRQGAGTGASTENVYTYAGGSDLVSTGTGGPTRSQSTTANTASQELVGIVRDGPHNNPYGTDMCDPRRLSLQRAPREGTETRRTLWSCRNAGIAGAWYYLADNGDLKQFWACQALQLEEHFTRGVRQCVLTEPTHIGPTSEMGWRTTVYRVDFDEAEMTNLVENTTRSIIRLQQGTPLSLLAPPRTGETASQAGNRAGVLTPQGEDQ